MGGENEFDTQTNAHAWGSSPRGRGKRGFRCIARVVDRLIPAWAGKTCRAGLLTGCSAAHPRVGGENFWWIAESSCAKGSSPRGRGKLRPGLLGLTPTRLIPAWAGKTASCAAGASPPAAHPRVGGENSAGVQPCEMSWGSSPRGRGKPKAPIPFRLGARLIPAWAGKTISLFVLRLVTWAHPRVGGEN